MELEQRCSPAENLPHRWGQSDRIALTVQRIAEQNVCQRMRSSRPFGSAPAADLLETGSPHFSPIMQRSAVLWDGFPNPSGSDGLGNPSHDGPNIRRRKPLAEIAPATTAMAAVVVPLLDHGHKYRYRWEELQAEHEQQIGQTGPAGG